MCETDFTESTGHRDAEGWGSCHSYVKSYSLVSHIRGAPLPLITYPGSSSGIIKLFSIPLSLLYSFLSSSHLVSVGEVQWVFYFCLSLNSCPYTRNLILNPRSYWHYFPTSVSFLSKIMLGKIFIIASYPNKIKEGAKSEIKRINGSLNWVSGLLWNSPPAAWQ